MAHLGRNLLPTWPILRPSWTHLRPNFAKNLHQIVKKRPQTPQDDPGGRQRPPGQPWSLIFNGFSGSILDFICKSFSKDLTQFATPCSIQLQSRRFGTVAALRAQRIGYCKAHIRRPPQGCRACVSLGVQLVQYQISNST